MPKAGEIWIRLARIVHIVEDTVEAMVSDSEGNLSDKHVEKFPRHIWEKTFLPHGRNYVSRALIQEANNGAVLFVLVNNNNRPLSPGKASLRLGKQVFVQTYHRP